MSVVTFDIETAAADELFTYGEGFVRLCGADPLGKPELTTDAYERKTSWESSRTTCI
jgi:hypothetical protein